MATSEYADRTVVMLAKNEAGSSGKFIFEWGISSLVNQDLGIVLKEIEQCIYQIESELFADADAEILNGWRYILGNCLGILKKFGDYNNEWDLWFSTTPVANIQLRIERALPHIMASMSILESRREIQETESVTRLTELAFIFVPLSYVAGDGDSC